MTEPSPISDSEVYQDNTIILHRLVSEGDVNGVRLVCISMGLLELVLLRNLGIFILNLFIPYLIQRSTCKGIGKWY